MNTEREEKAVFRILQETSLFAVEGGRGNLLLETIVCLQESCVPVSQTDQVEKKNQRAETEVDSETEVEELLN